MVQTLHDSKEDVSKSQDVEDQTVCVQNLQSAH